MRPHSEDLRSRCIFCQIRGVYEVLQVPDDVADLTEQLGTKPKFWFIREGEDWLFKESRPGTGEDWSEKIAAELASLLQLPHADYELAVWRGRRGVVTPKFVPEGGRLVHGNELIARVIEDYPRSQFFRVSQHTLDIVLAFVNSAVVKTPLEFPEEPEISTGGDVFLGYLMLDTWIANQDRHHENWALVRTESGNVHLAPSYDHASSLGRNESDEKRRSRLESKDPQYCMDAYVRRARSALYGEADDEKALSTIEAFRRAAELRPSAALAWLDRLSHVETASVTSLFQNVPGSLISDAAIEFASSILSLNRERLLDLRESLL